MSHETFELIEQLKQAGKRATMATLVRTIGTTPRKEGTKMFLGEDGAIFGSVTIGGCVDARVIENSVEVLASSTPRLLNMQLGDEEAWEIGLTCGGQVDVFVEPVDDSIVAMYEAARAEWEAGHTVAVAIVIGGAGPVGSHLLIGAGGALRGAIEGPLKSTLVSEVPRLSQSRTISYTLADGSTSDVYVEVLRPPSMLVIFGGGAVTQPLVTFAHALGFHTTVVDGRPQFANRERFPHADEIRLGIPSEIAGQMHFGPRTPLVLVAHDYKYDIPVLKTALTTDAPYIGLLGSRRRGATILQMLRDDGIAEEQLARVRVPIGLDLGGETAAEIALAIVAEIVAVTHGREGGGLSATTKAGTATV